MPPIDEAARKAYTVAEFCAAHRISKAQYYELKKIKKTPDEMHARGRVIISVEAAERWRLAREKEAREAPPKQHLRRRRRR